VKCDFHEAPPNPPQRGGLFYFLIYAFYVKIPDDRKFCNFHPLKRELLPHPGVFILIDEKYFLTKNEFFDVVFHAGFEYHIYLV